jgi:hypothetical protein
MKPAQAKQPMKHHKKTITKQIAYCRVHEFGMFYNFSRQKKHENACHCGKISINIKHTLVHAIYVQISWD